MKLLCGNDIYAGIKSSLCLREHNKSLYFALRKKFPGTARFQSAGTENQNEISLENIPFSEWNIPETYVSFRRAGKSAKQGGQILFRSKTQSKFAE